MTVIRQRAKTLINKEKFMAQQLNVGQPFPDYSVSTVDGKTLNIPRDLTGEYSVLLFYRGGW